LKKAKGKAVMHGRVRGLSLETPERDGSTRFEWQNRILTSPVVVKGAKSGTPADSAGFKSGDRIVAIDRYTTFNRARYSSVLGAYPAGHMVTFWVKRPEPMPSTREKDVKIQVRLTAPKNLSLGCAVRAGRVRVGGRQVTGLVVLAVPRNGPAAKAGLRPGDVITAINGKKLDSANALRSVFRGINEKYDVGDKVKLTVNRGGRRRTVDLPLSSAYN
jgi:S1-C subfamily serine protease